MQLNSNNIKYIIGDQDTLEYMSKIPVFQVFDPQVINYLDSVSKHLLSDKEAKQYSDVITFGFWCRKASIIGLQKQYGMEQNRIGKGVVFHIAPSNVAVNFAYSLVAGMLAGNANIVRLPSKNFEQVRIICGALKKAFTQDIKPYLCLLQYGHDQEITDRISALCDARVIWGGDQTIMRIRKSPLKARANEITFAERYSICVINADEFLKAENKKSIITGFYNDTYLTDQNACTSPRIIIWLGNSKKEAQDLFWNEVHALVKEKYLLQPVQVVNKYTSLCKIAAANQPVHRIDDIDNYIVRVKVDELKEEIMYYKGSCGYFFEYEANRLEEILPICSGGCQTLSYYGIVQNDINHFIITSKPKGIDRVVPIGKTLDFSLIWDGYDLISSMSRVILFN